MVLIKIKSFGEKKNTQTLLWQFKKSKGTRK